MNHRNVTMRAAALGLHPARAAALQAAAMWLFRVASAAALGWLWEYGHWGAMLSILLIPLVVMGRSRMDRYGVALATQTAPAVFYPLPHDSH
ncbi:hypothetical protein JKG47_17900 [Acidithiobacillus sp. MC6.1]|nr:hypothetical protein [Acidithiobacillus sp. MC6.1]